MTNRFRLKDKDKDKYKYCWVTIYDITLKSNPC